MRTTGFRAVRYPRGIVFALARALVSWLRGSPPVRYDVEVVFVAVEQNRLRSGVGRALLAKALEELRQRGKRGVFLRVAENNVAAIGFYESAGFEPVINWRGKRIMRREIKA
jgi:ribosomal protein S18 acetylase RimI-like enzyme